MKPLNHPEAEAFLRSIAAKPEDHLPRLVFSDWLDENGHTAAAHGMRWSVANGKMPLADSGAINGWHFAGRQPARRVHTDQPYYLPAAYELAGVGSLADPDTAEHPMDLHRGAEDLATHWRDFLHTSSQVRWREPDTDMTPAGPEGHGA